MLAREENPIVEGKHSPTSKRKKKKKTTPPRETSRNPEKWLRQQPALEMSVPGEEGQGQGIGEEEAGEGGWSSQTKSPSKVAPLPEEPARRSCLQ